MCQVFLWPLIDLYLDLVDKNLVMWPSLSAKEAGKSVFSFSNLNGKKKTQAKRAQISVE